MAKKSFNNMDNPALQFMSQTEEVGTAPSGHGSVGTQGEAREAKRGRKPSKDETKTKRLNLLMFPSVCADIDKIAYMQRKSTNDLINSILQDYIRENSDLLEKYNEVFRDE